jgi:hypothetical protein
MDEDDEIPPLEDMSETIQRSNSAVPLKMNTYLEVEGDEEIQKSKIVNGMMKDSKSTADNTEASASGNRRSTVKKNEASKKGLKIMLLKNKNKQKFTDNFYDQFYRKT